MTKMAITSPTSFQIKELTCDSLRRKIIETRDVDTKSIKTTREDGDEDYTQYNTLFLNFGH